MTTCGPEWFWPEGYQETNVRDATSKQIAQTLANMTAEVKANGISDAASDMWLHALTMYRRHKLGETIPGIPNNELPALLRRQAE